MLPNFVHYVKNTKWTFYPELHAEQNRKKDFTELGLKVSIAWDEQFIYKALFTKCQQLLFTCIFQRNY